MIIAKENAREPAPNKKFHLMYILKRTEMYMYIVRTVPFDGSSNCLLTPLIPINLSPVPQTFGVFQLGWRVSPLWIFRSLHVLDNIVSVVRVALLERWPEVLVHDLFDAAWQLLLVWPVVSDEFTFAIPRVHISVCFVAREDVKLLGVVVSKVLIDDGLLVGVCQFPHSAARVPVLVGTGHPCVEKLFTLWSLVSDDEAGVQVDVELFDVEEEGIIGILGQSHGGIVGNTPVVEEPFKRQMKMCEDGIAIEENNIFVVLDGLTHRRNLVPCSVKCGVIGELHDLVIISVKHSCGGSVIRI